VCVVSSKQLLAEDVVCEVVAPSLIPVKPSPHVAQNLADEHYEAHVASGHAQLEAAPLGLALRF